ncbi:DUF3122 domain-containing protein [Pleurocapsa sp. PCC 7319]|uniref:DUF3122 domain-containing protein n=1 Tax=Pleurocapsa sp. PCC 7319 TaxID=118161 RepID=UPI0003470CCD|nr:DUF3122 domain-containing protein [Pleurocapsa sp. PCC 7319]
MLRDILHDLEWGIAFVIMTLILFVIIALLTSEPAIASGGGLRPIAKPERSPIATITETDIAPGQVLCRSEHVLSDEAGQKWDVMFFTQANTPQVTSLNLRLSGLSSALKIQSQRSLVIDIQGDRYKASDIFLQEAPLPSIGQYNLKNILPQLPTTDLFLEIPLEKGKLSRLHIPIAVVKEWQAVASKNSNPAPKLPSSIELFC